MNTNKKEFIYSPAELKKYSSGWIITYKYTHPDTGELVTCREKVERERNKIKNDRLAEIDLLQKCKKRNKMLSEGWTPVGRLDKNSEESSTTVIDALRLYLSFNEPLLRPATFTCRKNIIEIFCKWLENDNKKRLTLSDVDEKLGVRYHDYLLLERKLSNRSFNFYFSILRTSFNWLIEERKMNCINPFLFKSKKTEKVKKNILPNEWFPKIVDWCKDNNPVFEIVINLIYSSFIRPTEICRCKVGNIDIANKCIHLPKESAKTHAARTVVLQQQTIELMIKHGILNANKKSYVIGKIYHKRGNCGTINRNLIIGADKPEQYISLFHIWEKMRDDIGIPKGYTLYSLKHKGISQLRELGFVMEQISTLSGHTRVEEVDTYTTDEARLKIARKVAEGCRTIEDVAEEVLGAKSTDGSKAGNDTNEEEVNMPKGTDPFSLAFEEMIGIAKKNGF